MNRLREALSTLSAVLAPLLKRRRTEAELEAELAFHLEMEAGKLHREGLPAESATRQARVAFGGVEGVKEACRDQRRVHWVETLGQDLRYACRSLASRPGVTLAVVTTLALGLAANGSVGSALSSLLLSPLPYDADNSLVVLRRAAPAQGVEDIGFSVPEIEDLRAEASSVRGVVEIHQMSFNLLGKGEPRWVRTGVVSSGWFDTLGLKPLMGRTFLPTDEGPTAEPVLVLSHGFWQRLGGDPGLVGSHFTMNDRTHQVVGVLPAVPEYPFENDVYMPTSACPFRSTPATVGNRLRRGYTLLARLTPGVTASAASVELNTLDATLRSRHPESYSPGVSFELRVRSVFEELTAPARSTLLLLWAGAALVLVVAAANVGSLWLARLLARRPEIALAIALGAGRNRLTRQLVLESTLPALAAAGLALALTAAGSRLLVAFLGRFTRRAPEVALDGATVTYVLGLAVVAGLVLGLLAASQLSANPAALGVGRSRGAGSVRSHRLRSALVVAQVAVAVLLVAGASLLLRSLLRLTQVDPGFDPQGVVAARIDLDWAQHGSAEQIRAFYTRLLDEVRSLPAVEEAALSSAIPLDNQLLGTSTLAFADRPLAPGEPLPVAQVRVVSPGYFELLAVPLLAGRPLASTDHGGSEVVALVNRSLAMRSGRIDELLGRRISLDQGQSWVQVVGVVGDVKQAGLAGVIRDEVFLAFPQSAGYTAELLLKTAAEPAVLAADLRRVVAAIDPEQPLATVRTLAEVRGDALAPPRLTALLLSLCAALGLGVSALGLASLLAYYVTERQHELGVRIALGAERRSVLTMILGRGLSLVVGGLALGLAAGAGLAVGLRGGLSTLLFEVRPTDPWAFGAGALALLAVGALASLLPAHRATTIDPVRALRAE